MPTKKKAAPKKRRTLADKDWTWTQVPYTRDKLILAFKLDLCRQWAINLVSTYQSIAAFWASASCDDRGVLAYQLKKYTRLPQNRAAPSRRGTGHVVDGIRSFERGCVCSHCRDYSNAPFPISERAYKKLIQEWRKL
jgi:hypothetical protein